MQGALALHMTATYMPPDNSRVYISVSWGYTQRQSYILLKVFLVHVCQLISQAKIIRLRAQLDTIINGLSLKEALTHAHCAI